MANPVSPIKTTCATPHFAAQDNRQLGVTVNDSQLVVPIGQYFGTVVQ